MCEMMCSFFNREMRKKVHQYITKRGALVLLGLPSVSLQRDFNICTTYLSSHLSKPHSRHHWVVSAPAAFLLPPPSCVFTPYHRDVPSKAVEKKSGNNFTTPNCLSGLVTTPR
jgi:hypothetical protein